MQPALLARAAAKLFRNVAFVKPIISSVNRLLPIFARPECLRLGIDEPLQSGEQVRLAPDLTGARRFVRLARVREEHLL